jgi:hypothetical protein
MKGQHDGSTCAMSLTSGQLCAIPVCSALACCLCKRLYSKHRALTKSTAASSLCTTYAFHVMCVRNSLQMSDMAVA